MSKREREQPFADDVHPKVFFEGHDKKSPIALQCPLCEQQYLHHKKIEIQNRTHEDEGGSKITVDGPGRLSIKNANPIEFLHRRDNILISFTCEHCCDEHKDLPLRLCIYQHKGQTLLEWTK
jgi:hypothetical protein